MSTQTDIILDKIFIEAREQKASEIYLFPGQLLSLRINGDIKFPAKSIVISELFINNIIKTFLTETERDYLNTQKQIMVIKETGKVGSVQMNVCFQNGNPAISFELLSRKIIDLEKLELPDMVTNVIKIPKGIIFITGPKDSGRSTLIMSLLDHINKTQSKFIATCEEPVKYRLKPVKSVIEQREIPWDVDTFTKGLLNIRQRNADIVMVSKIDSVQVMDQIFALSQQGSLVFAIIDTDSAIMTIQRVIHFYSPEKEAAARYFLSMNLGAIVSSRLIPRISGGRIRALEVLPGIPQVRSIIASGKFYQLDDILRTSQGGRAVSLEQYLADLVTSEEISPEEGMKCANNKEFFQSLLRK